MSFTNLIDDEKFDAQPPTKTRPGPHTQLTTVHFVKFSLGVVNAEVVEPRTIFVEHVGLTREQRHHVTLGNVTHHRDELVSNSIASKVEIVVRGVVQWLHVRSKYVVVHVATPYRAKGLSGIVHHRRKAVDARATQHVEQHRLGKVIHGVTGKRSLGQDSSSLGASARFEVATRFDVDVVDETGNAQLFTEGTHKLRVIAARRACVMVHVMHAHEELSFKCEQQEANGIRASRHGEINGATGWGKRARVKKSLGVWLHVCRLRNRPSYGRGACGVGPTGHQVTE